MSSVWASVVVLAAAVLLRLSSSSSSFVPTAGLSLSFNGDLAHKQYLTIRPKCTADGNPFQSANITIAAWIRCRVHTSMPPGMNLFGFDLNQGPGLTIGTNPATNLGTAISGKGSASCHHPMTLFPDLYDGQWHHLALTLGDDGFFAAYNDGAVQEWCTGVQQQPPYSDSFLMGVATTDMSSTSAHPFDGEFDDVRVYNRVFRDVDEFVANVMARPPTVDELARDLPIALSFDGDRDGGVIAVVQNDGFVPVAIDLGGGQRVRSPTLVPSTAPIWSRSPQAQMAVELVQDRTTASAPDLIRPLLIRTPRYNTTGAPTPSPSTVQVTVLDVRQARANVGNVTLGGVVLAPNLTLSGVTDTRLLFRQQLGVTGRGLLEVRANVTIDGVRWQAVRIVVDVRANIRPVAGSGGQAAVFDGVDDFYMADHLAWPKVVSNASGHLIRGLAPITVEFWALVDGSKRGDSAVFSLGGNTEFYADWMDYFNRLRKSERWNIFLPEPNGQASLFAQWNAYGSGRDVELFNGWFHFAFVHQHHTGPLVQVYINGELVLEENQGYMGMQNGFLDFNHATVGTWTFWSEVFYKGRLDDFRLWNYSRSGSEIRDDMYRQLTGSEANLFAYWTFDDDTGAVVVDKTGRGNDLRAGGCVPCEPRFYCQPFSATRYEFSPNDCIPSAKSPDSPRYRTHTCYGGTVCFQGEERAEMRPVLEPSGAPIGGHTFDLIGVGGQPIEIQLNGTDPDAVDDSMQFAIEELPSHGQLQYKAGDGSWVTITSAPFLLGHGLSSVRILSASGDGGAPFARLPYTVRDSWTASLPVSVDVNLLCLRGQYLDADARRCVPCPAGSYSDADDLRTRCDMCPPNQFQPNPGQTSCLRCSPGKTFTTAPGAIACDQCNAMSAATNPATIVATSSFCSLNFQTDNTVSTQGGLHTQIEFASLVPPGLGLDQVRVTLLNVPQYGAVYQVDDDGAVTDDDFRDYFSSSVEVVGQYAAGVVAVTSQLADRTANATLGEPDVGRAGGSSARAWAADTADSVVANLTLRFADPVYLTGLVLYENIGGGAVTQVEALRPDGTFTVLWTGDALPNGLGVARQFRPDICPTTFPTDTLRLTLNSLLCHGRNELDAVQLLGARDLRHSSRLLIRNPSLRVAYAPPTLASVPGGASLGYRYTDTISYAIQSCRTGAVVTSGVQTLQGTLGAFDLRDVHPSGATTSAALALAIIGLVTCAASSALILVLRQEPILRASSIFFLNVMVLGLGLGFLVLLLTAVHGLRPFAAFCMTRALLFSLGFNLLMGSIIVKTARIVVIFELTRGSKVVRVTNARLFAFVVAMIIVDLGILLTALGADPLRNTLVQTATTQYLTCDSRLGGLLLYFSTAYKALLAVVGLALAIKGRNVPSTFNEVRSLSFMAYTIATNSIIYLIISGLVSDDPNAALIVLTFTLSVALFSTWAILVAAKLYIVRFRPDQNSVDTGAGTSGVSSKVRTLNAAKYSLTGHRGSRTNSRVGMAQPKAPNTTAPESAAGAAGAPVAEPPAP